MSGMNDIDQVSDGALCNWQTIETAPEDGSHILAWVDDAWHEVHWEEHDEYMALEVGESGYWTFSDGQLSEEYLFAEFRYWIPIPEPPNAE